MFIFRSGHSTCGAAQLKATATVHARTHTRAHQSPVCPAHSSETATDLVKDKSPTPPVCRPSVILRGYAPIRRKPVSFTYFPKEGIYSPWRQTKLTLTVTLSFTIYICGNTNPNRHSNGNIFLRAFRLTPIKGCIALMKGIKNENDGKNSLHGIRRNGKTPFTLLVGWQEGNPAG